MVSLSGLPAGELQVEHATPDADPLVIDGVPGLEDEVTGIGPQDTDMLTDIRPSSSTPQNPSYNEHPDPDVDPQPELPPSDSAPGRDSDLIERWVQVTACDCFSVFGRSLVNQQKFF